MLSARCLLPNQSDRIDEEQHEAGPVEYIVSNNNRWSRITVNFEGIESDSWCEFTCELEPHAQEEKRSIHDFALIGIDFQTEDGESIDFVYVPGLARTHIDPHSWLVSGPDFRDYLGTACNVSHGFFIPSPARKLAVSIRSWRNSHPFTIRNLKLLQGTASKSADAVDYEASGHPGSSLIRMLNVRRSWRTLSTQATWFRLGVSPECRVLVRGQIINANPGSEGALARIVYRNARGTELPPPYPEMTVAPSLGAYIDIPVHRHARRFTLDLIPPPEAASVDIGFRTWADAARMELVTPLEISLEDDFSLEAISGDALPDAPTFLKQLAEKMIVGSDSIELNSADALLERFIDSTALASTFTFHDKLQNVQHGKRTTRSEGEITLGTFPAWALPDDPQWTEDPYQSLAWRLEFQSLTWLCNLATEGALENLTQAVDLAVSWSHANPWGHPSDPVSIHPRALSARAETFLHLLSLCVKAPNSISPRSLLILFAETVRHAFALAQIIGQNVFSHSIVHLQAACTLRTLAQALPRIPLASYWASLAWVHLEDGFDRLLDENGLSIEQSLHVQLELISLGLISIRQLESEPEALDFCNRLAVRLRRALRTLVAATAPSGLLPPFGDAPYGFHHASWLRRLLSEFGASLLSDSDLAAELSYPTGERIFLSEQAGLISARHYERNARWSYFCASLRSGHHENGHHDCTSFVYSAGGAPWIVDPRGSSFHETGAARQYLIGSRAHNVAHPDEREQLAGLSWIEHYGEAGDARIFKIGSNVYGSSYEHHRFFIALKRLDAIAVLDRFTTRARPVSFEGLLHFDSSVIAAIANTQMGVAYRGDDKLRIIPYTVDGSFSGMSVENGRKDLPGKIQGFVAHPTGRLQPSNVIRYRFTGQKSVCGGVLLATSDQAARILSSLLKMEAVHNLLSDQSDESTQTDSRHREHRIWTPDEIGRP
ncbi:heparinase II/III domain-containing protein [Microvirga makkahensis]|uniref:Heparinase n=1 Tax=Microvirga makkahensis TaxID=1128670 RepID=A0A7X3MR04_9HYPH|nr:heparinase II/III family protein [Microvirga makkahensis]MXQ11649.1 heparinase [Microvirga makkahensis]